MTARRLLGELARTWCALAIGGGVLAILAAAEIVRRWER